MKPQPSNPQKSHNPKWEEDDFSIDSWDHDGDGTYFEPIKKRKQSRPNNSGKEFQRNKKDRQQRSFARRRKQETDYDWGDDE
jgi:hypothetical protein